MLCRFFLFRALAPPPPGACTLDINEGWYTIMVNRLAGVAALLVSGVAQGGLCLTMTADIYCCQSNGLLKKKYAEVPCAQACNFDNGTYCLQIYCGPGNPWHYFIINNPSCLGCPGGSLAYMHFRADPCVSNNCTRTDCEGSLFMDISACQGSCVVESCAPTETAFSLATEPCV